MHLDGKKFVNYYDQKLLKRLVFSDDIEQELNNPKVIKLIKSPIFDERMDYAIKKNAQIQNFDYLVKENILELFQVARNLNYDSDDLRRAKIHKNNELLIILNTTPLDKEHRIYFDEAVKRGRTFPDANDIEEIKKQMIKSIKNDILVLDSFVTNSNDYVKNYLINQVLEINFLDTITTIIKEKPELFKNPDVYYRTIQVLEKKNKPLLKKMCFYDFKSIVINAPGIEKISKPFDKSDFNRKTFVLRNEGLINWLRDDKR